MVSMKTDWTEMKATAFEPSLSTPGRRPRGRLHDRTPHTALKDGPVHPRRSYKRRGSTTSLLE